MNLRGVKGVRQGLAIPTYGFVLGVASMIAYGLFQAVTGDAPQAESARYTVVPEEGKAA
jgi:hypothetical protein